MHDSFKILELLKRERLTFKELSSKYITDYNTVILGMANEEVRLNPDRNRKTQKDDIIIYISN